MQSKKTLTLLFVLTLSFIRRADASDWKLTSKAVQTPSRGGGFGQKASVPSSPEAIGTGSATIPNEVFNLVKSIVGVGVLSLPAGIAAFGTSKSALAPALLFITVIGVLSGYGFSLIGRVCAYTGAISYRDAWSKSVGESSSWIAGWSTTIKTFLACLAFSMVLGDTFSSILSQPRTISLLGVTFCVLLPLCWMKDLASLAPFSLLGVCGMLYTALAMTVRSLDGTYRLPDGPFLADVAEDLRPAFDNANGLATAFSPRALILICMLSTAYMAHFK